MIEPEKVTAWGRQIVGAVVVIGFFGTLAIMLWQGKFPDVVATLVGSVAGSYMTIVAYHFGSSSGSERKTELLAKAPPVEDGQ